jgi:hypothetical protein
MLQKVETNAVCEDASALSSLIRKLVKTCGSGYEYIHHYLLCCDVQSLARALSEGVYVFFSSEFINP